MCFHTSAVETSITKSLICIFIHKPRDLVANEVMGWGTRFCVCPVIGNEGWTVFPGVGATLGNCCFRIQIISKPVVVQVCNPSIWEAKTGRWQVQDPLKLHYIMSSVVEPGLYNEELSPFHASLLPISSRSILFKIRVLGLLLSGPIIIYFDSLAFRYV